MLKSTYKQPIKNKTVYEVAKGDEGGRVSLLIWCVRNINNHLIKVVSMNLQPNNNIKTEYKKKYNTTGIQKPKQNKETLKKIPLNP